MRELESKAPSGQGRWDPDSLRPALSLGGQATAWECTPGRSLCLTKSSACGRLWQFAHPRPLSLLHPGTTLTQADCMSALPTGSCSLVLCLSTIPHHCPTAPAANRHPPQASGTAFPTLALPGELRSQRIIYITAAGPPPCTSQLGQFWPISPGPFSPSLGSSVCAPLP